MVFLYNTGVLTYYTLIKISSLFNNKAKKWIEGRKGLFKQIEETLSSSDKIAWFHCASLGEFEQGRPVMEALKKSKPDYKILLTFFSPSGYEVRKNYPLADYVFYLPLDTKANAKKFITLCNPRLVVFVKYEYWYHFINELKKRKIPLFIISAIFREKQVFFKIYGGWWKSMLKKVTHIYLQDQYSNKLLNSINIQNCSIAGDTRFDQVHQTASQKEPVSEIEFFCKDNPILVAGSTWPEDEDLLSQFIQNYPSGWKFIIAPHEIHPERIRQLEDVLKRVETIKFSEIKNTAIFPEAKVLIIDNIGYLSRIYAYGKVAYIGGGFGKGIHNILEATAFGLPVIFGPNYSKFKEAKDLVSEGGAFSVKSSAEFHEAILSASSIGISEKCLNYVIKNKGATKKIIEDLLKQA